MEPKISQDCYATRPAGSRAARRIGGDAGNVKFLQQIVNPVTEPASMARFPNHVSSISFVEGALETSLHERGQIRDSWGCDPGRQPKLLPQSNALSRPLNDLRGCMAKNPLNGRTVLYPQSDESGSVLMLVENFR